MKCYDYIIVGAGLFGAVFAREATDAGKKVLVVERRSHIGGNCYTENRSGIIVHAYGPHIFHTADRKIWDYMNRWTKFNNFSLRVKVFHGGTLYSFPINLFTLHQLWGVTTPQEAEVKLSQVRVPCDNPRNLEEWALSEVGQDLYETFIHGYTTKQWGREPSDLPSSIIRRLPIRLTHNDRHFPDQDIYEGIPIGGYTPIFEKLLDGIEVKLGVDYLDDPGIGNMAEKVVYTGPIDAFSGYKFGPLEYRSLRFEQEERTGDFQGNAIVNYTDRNVPWTRIVEHKHFALQSAPNTIITREFPQEYVPGLEPYYPIGDQKNTALCEIYRLEAEKSGVIFGGRLARYKYYDMHQVVASALSCVKQECGVGNRNKAV